jgi:GT2 family glycosyltransferase
MEGPSDIDTSLSPIISCNTRPTVPTANLAQLTAIIKTFERPKCLARLLSSMQQFYPDLRVLVADDSLANDTPGVSARDIRLPANVSYLRLPADVGLSAGRNAMLARVCTPYFLLLDDDLQFHRRTRLEFLLQQVASGQQDVAAGDLVYCQRKMLFVRRSAQPAHGVLRVESEQLSLQRGGTLTDDGVVRCDLAHNFFVARTDRIRAMGGWDPDLKLDEQEEFFFRAKQFDLRVGMCPNVTAWHWASRRPDPRYSEYRSRSFKSLAVDKMGFNRLVDYDGRVTYGSARSQAA